MSLKPERRTDTIEVSYSSQRWELLDIFRKKAAILIKSLENHHLQAIVHGSIARGDVKQAA